MKRFFLLLALVVTLVGCDASRCEIVGRIDNFEVNGMVYLIDKWNAHTIIDSTKLTNNTFRFKSVEHEPTFAQLVSDSGRPISVLFVEEGKILVTGDALLGVSKATGTPANDAFVAMMDRSEELMARHRKAMGDRDMATVEAIAKEHEALNEECFEKNKNNAFGLFMLQQQAYMLSSKEFLDKFVQLPEQLQKLPFAERQKALAERKFKTEPQVEGSDYVPHYIDIVHPDLNGSELSLKSVVENDKNRYVLLDFWASWYRFRTESEVEALKQAYSEYHDKGFEVFAVSLDTREEFWKEAVEEQGLSWIHVSSLQEMKSPEVEDYAVEQNLLPNFLIDCSNGVIIAKNLRGEALFEKLAELYK